MPTLDLASKGRLVLTPEAAAPWPPMTPRRSALVPPGLCNDRAWKNNNKSTDLPQTRPRCPVIVLRRRLPWLLAASAMLGRCSCDLYNKHRQLASSTFTASPCVALSICPFRHVPSTAPLISRYQIDHQGNRKHALGGFGPVRLSCLSNFDRTAEQISVVKGTHTIH